MASMAALYRATSWGPLSPSEGRHQEAVQFQVHHMQKVHLSFPLVSLFFSLALLTLTKYQALP